MKNFTRFALLCLCALAPVSPTMWKYHSIEEKGKIPFLKESLNKNPYDNLTEALGRLKLANFAKAQSALTEHATNNMRDSIGLVIGYGDHVAYGDLACNGVDPGPNTDCSGPPYDGIVGRLTTILNTLPSIGHSIGIDECTAVPATGTFTGTDSNSTSVTVTFASPTHSIPTPWENGGVAFQKRVEFTESIMGETAKIAYEFNCGDSPALYAAINMDMGGAPIDGHTYTRLISVFTGPISSTKKGIEVNMAEYSSDNRIRAADAFRIEYVPSASTFELWGLMDTHMAMQNMVVARTAMSGNYSTGVTSVFYSGYITPQAAGNDSAIDKATITGAGALASANDLTDGAGGTPGHNFSQDLQPLGAGPVLKRGCIDFNSPDTDPANSTDCAGHTLSAVTSAPYVDATGDFTLAWLLNTMPTKLEVLP